MAPKPKRYLHQGSGRWYRLSQDGRFFVFEDNGQTIPIASTQREGEAGPSSRGRADQSGSEDNATGSDATEDDVPEDDAPPSLEKLTIGPGARGQGIRSGRESGVTEWVGGDRRTGIQSNWEFGPRQKVSESNVRPLLSYNPKFIRSNGASAQAQGLGAIGVHAFAVTEKPKYKRSAEPTKDFRLFRVIEILFVPPPTTTLSTINGGAPQSGSRDEQPTRMRRFVIIGPGDRPGGSFRALPIKTYNGKGVSASGVVKSHHAIIHSSNKAPKPMDDEHPQRLPNSTRLESGMLQQAIRVKTYDRETALDSISRLDFFDLYEFDYNHYFYTFGSVHADSRPYLIPQFNAVRVALQLSTYQVKPPSPQTLASHARSNPQVTGSASQSSHDVLVAAINAVGVTLNRFRSYARDHEYTEPIMTPTELYQCALDRDAHERWVQEITSDFEAQKAAREAEDSEDSDSDEGETDNEDGSGEDNDEEGSGEEDDD